MYSDNITGEQIFPGPIASDSQIKVTCDDGFFPDRQNSDVSTCVNGVWTPELVLCEKTDMCKTSDLAREITDFIVSETKTAPEEFVPHNQSIEAVCGEGNISQGILTCNAGIWMGNSTCEQGCVLKDPGMHFISLGNRTVLNVGENANVSCKDGYQIVPNIYAKRAHHSESTADLSEMLETEDNENLIPVSDGIYTCRENGKWEPEIRFSCEQIICYRCDLENGIIYPASQLIFTVGTVATFQCNYGYVLDGPETRTCQIDGTWSGECVTCQREGRNPSTTCPAPCIPEGARKTGSQLYDIGSKVEFHCCRSKTNDCYDRSNIRHCIKNGEYASWNGTMINCKDTCSLTPVKGTLYRYKVTKDQVFHGPIASDRQIKVTCEDGFFPNKQNYDVSRCVNGVWTPEIVKCEKTDTCLLSPVKGTLYSYKVTKEQVFYGPIASYRQIKVTCEDGFFPNKQTYDVSRCVNGVWTPEIVKCEKMTTQSMHGL